LPISKVTGKWLAIAQADLRDAKALLEMNEKFLRLVVFSAQQSAEKAIKAYLTEKRVRHPKTHQIDDLLKLVAQKNLSLSEKIYAAVRLSAYAIAFRYPDAATEDLNLEMAQKAVRIAEDTMENILKELDY
jgi:HEPN domain-containing protein